MNGEAAVGIQKNPEKDQWNSQRLNNNRQRFNKRRCLPFSKFHSGLWNLEDDRHLLLTKKVLNF